MVVPVADQAAQQIRPAQERAVGRRRAADDDVVAAAGAGVAAVEHELLGAEPRQPRLFVQRRRVIDQLGPALRRVQVDFDDAGIGRDFEVVQPRDRAAAASPSMITGISERCRGPSIAATRSR